jgi:Immunity protein Imm1
MQKYTHFDNLPRSGWPHPSAMEPFFLGPPGRRWIFSGRNDCWGLNAEGLDGTEGLRPDEGRIDLRLTMLGHPRFGVLLHYDKYPRDRHDCYSKGDLSRLREWVLTKHGDLMPIGLFVPFEAAWRAVNEYMATDGTLPRSIEWIAGEDIPSGVFPRPWADVPFHR